jgi:hypothetical protein
VANLTTSPQVKSQKGLHLPRKDAKNAKINLGIKSKTPEKNLVVKFSLPWRALRLWRKRKTQNSSHHSRKFHSGQKIPVSRKGAKGAKFKLGIFYEHSRKSDLFVVVAPRQLFHKIHRRNIYEEAGSFLIAGSESCMKSLLACRAWHLRPK